jgi:hypothetical protein
MDILTAIKILKDHNEWRRYDGDILKQGKMIHPQKIGIAIDTVVAKFNEIS